MESVLTWNKKVLLRLDGINITKKIVRGGPFRQQSFVRGGPFQTKKTDQDLQKSPKPTSPTSIKSLRSLPSLPSLDPLDHGEHEDFSKTIIERPDTRTITTDNTSPFSSPIPSYVEEKTPDVSDEFDSFDQTEALESPFSKISTRPDPPGFLIHPPHQNSPLNSQINSQAVSNQSKKVDSFFQTVEA